MEGPLLAMEWALLAFLRAHRMGSRLDKWARGDPKWEKHDGAGGPITGGVVNTWDMIGYPQEVRKENGRVLGKKELGLALLEPILGSFRRKSGLPWWLRW